MHAGAQLSRAQRFQIEKARSLRLLEGQNGLYKEWNEDDHPRAPAGGPDGGEFVGGGGGGEGGVQPAVGGPAGNGPAGDGQSSGGFTRRDPRDAEQLRAVIAVHEPSPQLASELKAKGAQPLSFHELDPAKGAQRFHDAITAAKQNKYGAAVTAYPADDYKSMRLFLTPDGQSGFALKGDDIVSVFKHPDSKVKGVATTMLALATQQGGRRLDCFDTMLPELYSKSGFHAVARVGFSDEFAPPGWDRATFKSFNGGRPDVVFMAYNPADKALYQAGDGTRIDDYDSGAAKQADYLAKPNAPAKGGKSKKPAKKEDFDKAKIKLDVSSAQQEAFIDRWNQNVGEDPAEFKAKFMGGLDGPMKIGGSGGKIDIEGEVHDADGHQLGTFTRNIDLNAKSAYSAYFKLNKSATKHDTGKKMLAGNVETYKGLGIEKVEVTANIDVGGYAWAKYGYVPTQSSWNKLRGELETKLTGGARSSRPVSDNTIEADDWDQLSSDVQSDVRDRWMRDSRDEFIASEEQSWRESGQAKDDAKRELASGFHQYNEIPEWASEAFDGARQYREDKGQTPIPYTNKQLFDAITLDYESRNGDGEDDPDITFDDKELAEPIGYDPAQQTLPGIEPIEPHEMLTQDMRDRIEKDLTAGFDAKAESDAQEMDAPSYLADNVEEYQDDYWNSKSEREMLQHAVDYGMADIEIEPDEDAEPPQAELELPKTEDNPLLAAVRSSDPKSIWKVADSAQGKPLLLGTGWNGVLNLKDKASMDRFDKYVGRAA